jgi:hypothetical protein
MSDLERLTDESVERLRHIEYWSQSLAEFERYKRQAYEIVSHEPNIGFPWVLGSPLLHLVINKDSDIISDYRKIDWNGVDAIVQSSGKCIDEKLQHYQLRGIPVRKAKGKWLKNMILKYYH